MKEIPQKPIASIEDDICGTHFRKTHSRAKGRRYTVSIPFKDALPLTIGESKYRATDCLHPIEGRFLRDKDLRQQYVKSCKSENL